jgi:hypothetical protein
MNNCSLCGRKMFVSKYNFGLSCLKKSCDILNIKDIKNLKGEKVLDKDIATRLNKTNLSNTQKKLLTNRYLTLKLLEQVNISYYDKTKNDILEDIAKINSKSTEKDLGTINTMPLKYANQIVNLYFKYKLFNDIWNTDKFNNIQNLSFNTILFGFSSYYNKKPYLSGLLQKIQMLIWKAGIEVLKNRKLNCSAKFLEHSLQQKPNDLVILDNDEIIEKIKSDARFKEKIKDIIAAYGVNSNYFNTSNENLKEDSKNNVLYFKSRDLFLSLNNTNIQVIGNKINNKWILDITLTDIYDFTDFKELQEYFDENIFNSFIGSTANNAAMISTSCGLINPYNITIRFKIENYEV